jgi:hypothetical protein
MKSRERYLSWMFHIVRMRSMRCDPELSSSGLASRSQETLLDSTSKKHQSSLMMPGGARFHGVPTLLYPR